jgi:hypothetical protein
MTTADFILTLFCAVDQERLDVPKPPAATLSARAVVTLALWLAITGGGPRAFYRWLTRASRPLCPQVPERTRWARLFTTHTAWPPRFLAAPTGLGVADSAGIEVLHPLREGRRPAQMGQQGTRHHRWMVGGTRCCILPQGGLLWAWDGATATVPDTPFHPLIVPGAGQMRVWADTGFQAKTGDPAPLTVCPRGTGNPRMLGEPVLSRRTTVFYSKQVGQRVWAYFRARIASMLAACNILARWGMEVDEHTMVRLSIAACSL